jgi:hypothetical protein
MDISAGAKPFGSRLWPCPVYVLANLLLPK